MRLRTDPSEYVYTGRRRRGIGGGIARLFAIVCIALMSVALGTWLAEKTAPYQSKVGIVITVPARAVATDSADEGSGQVAVSALQLDGEASGDGGTNADGGPVETFAAAGNGAVSAASGPAAVISGANWLEGKTAWSNGDSTSYFMTVSLYEQLQALGAVPVEEAEAVNSSGLNSPEFFDWPGYLESQMAEYDPDVVFFMIGANDAKPGMDLAAYAEKVGAVMDSLNGRQVFWIGQPAFDPELRPDLADWIPLVNEVFVREAEKRPWVRYIDTWGATTDASGHYARSLPGAGGELEEIRTADGVHFTDAGGRRLASWVLAAIE